MDDIVRFIEPILRFCLKRVNNRADAEDLASEIVLHALEGIRKYNITAIDAWVWRIAHNRYARYCAAKKYNAVACADEFMINLAGDYDAVDEASISGDYERVFRYLHTLSSEYKNILVDYYIGEMPVKALAKKYKLSETTVKWRLNMSRQKICDRIDINGGNEVENIYKRINWESTSCNGSMNAGAYLSNQVARAICEAAYEKPLAIEEISLRTGLPTMYIEDELPRLIYGDAIQKVGNKYATDFIILRLADGAKLEKNILPLISDVADYYEKLFADCEHNVAAAGFYGCDFGMCRLGYIALPLSMRKKVKTIKNNMHGFESGAYPPRKDGGYGWFIVQEAADENDCASEYMSGCNITDDEDGVIYWFNIAKYFCNNIYHNGGTRWLTANRIPQKCVNGAIPQDVLSEDDIVRLLRVNLIAKSDNGYKLNFPCFTSKQFANFSSLFDIKDEKLDSPLAELIQSIKSGFTAFVPKRLDSQINQWVSCYAHNLIGYVTEALISRGALEKPDDIKPMTNGVFYVEGNNINV